MLSKSKKNFNIWIISGPSGSGKTSLSEALLKDVYFGKRLTKSVSCTTRQKRAGEIDGRDYVYVTQEFFKKGLSKGAYLEHEKIFGFFYGTPKKAVSDAKKMGLDLLLCIDVKGARAVRRVFKKETTSIFILPPHIEALNHRLNKRSTESKKDIENRLKRVKIELSLAREYDYIVVNDDFSDALRKIKSIFIAKECEVKTYRKH